MLSAEGYANLVNMLNGFLGARDEMGRIVEPGWQGCGLPCETSAPPERAWPAVRAKR